MTDPLAFGQVCCRSDSSDTTESDRGEDLPRREAPVHNSHPAGEPRRLRRTPRAETELRASRQDANHPPQVSPGMSG